MFLCISCQYCCCVLLFFPLWGAYMFSILNFPAAVFIVIVMCLSLCVCTLVMLCSHLLCIAIATPASLYVSCPSFLFFVFRCPPIYCVFSCFGCVFLGPVCLLYRCNVYPFLFHCFF